MPPKVKQIRTRKMRVDFYTINTQAGPQFHNILQKCSSIPDGDARSYLDSDFISHLSKLEYKDGLWEGDLYRLKINDPAFKGSTSGQVTMVPLKANEGMSDFVAFIFDPSNNVLVWQKNTAGPKIQPFITFCTSNGGPGAAPVVEYMLEKDVLRKLERAPMVRSLNAKIAPSHSMLVSSDPDHGVSEVLKLAKLYSGPNVEIIVSVGRKKSGLNAVQILKTIKSLLTFSKTGDETVKKLKVNIQDELGDNEPIDLLEQTIRGEIEVEKLADPDEYYTARMDQLRSLYIKKRSTL